MCSIKTRARAPVMGYGLCAFSSLLIKHTPLNSSIWLCVCVSVSQQCCGSALYARQRNPGVRHLLVCSSQRAL